MPAVRQKLHLASCANFRPALVPLKNLIYRIVAVDGDAPPVTVTHCMTEVEAKTWIRQQLKDDVRTAMDRLMDAAKAIR